MDCDEHIARALELADSLLELANADRNGCEHDGCLLLDGIVRDSALKIRQVALRWALELHTTTNGVRKST
ncbi:MAG TPA: hypothetical protein PKJ99_04185 [Thermoanaerobaculales bacterium]|nr:hypothetical protein [Thermoanaerobaculales bacterium]HPA79766.1 hypothetical protein [Thermoanaerobaculales bacterium]HQN94742.1 hypothetical protein [Thermoanaerobaculales bacterium]HQP42377.1 hypothetical protein [Thermoanaerobaculales bacterium]